VITISDFPEELEFDDILTTIKKDLIDFKTRDIVAKETANIRTLLIAKAFANNDEFDEVPFGDINDPIGFDAKEF